MKKVIFITGASRGMGKTTGEFLVKRGHTVYGTARNPGKYAGHPFPLIKMDLEDEKSISAAIKEVAGKEGKIDVLINNAGRGMMGPLEETPPEIMQQVFQTNVFGPVEVIRQVLPYMRRQKKGLIINISSVAGFLGLPFRGPYSASKAAVMIISETLRYELYGSGIEVTDVCPGDIATGIAEHRVYVPVSSGSPYYAEYHRIIKETDAEVDKGLPPEAVARKIVEIIEKKHPRPQYRVAPFTQKILPVIKALLPASWFEAIIRKHYKIK